MLSYKTISFPSFSVPASEDALLFLSYLNFDYKIKDELLNHFTLEHIEEIFDLSGDYFKENKLLTKNNIEKLVEEREKFNSDAYRDFLEKKKVKYVSILSENYPINLKDIEYIPQVIYYKGDILPEDEFALSIVGSRKCTNYGAWATEYFARSISELGIRIVSGMALGIDSISHRAALKSGGRTIAVLGCGVDIAYPKTNYRLYDEIIENGAVMSEFPIGMPPLAHNFPVRNRIISGLDFSSFGAPFQADANGVMGIVKVLTTPVLLVFAFSLMMSDFFDTMGSAMAIAKQGEFLTKARDTLKTISVIGSNNYRKLLWRKRTPY